MSNGKLFIISGPSGVGKGTILKRLFNDFPDDIVFSISATTRNPREGEINGKDYFFISKNEFLNRLYKEEFLEHASYSDNYYGTPKQFVFNELEKGHHVFLEIDVQGATQIMKTVPECVSIFILPPNYEELEKRLRNRGTESNIVIQKRLSQASKELLSAPNYKYNIINNDINVAYNEFKKIFLKEIEPKHKEDS